MATLRNRGLGAAARFDRAAVEQSAAFDKILEASDGLQGLKLLLSGPDRRRACDLELPGMDGFAPHAHRRARRQCEIPSSSSPRSPTTTGAPPAGGASDDQQALHPADLVARSAALKLVRLSAADEQNKLLGGSRDRPCGLRNRRYLTEVLSVEFLRAKRYPRHSPS
jgi:CheY-like chemotaxis protein